MTLHKTITRPAACGAAVASLTALLLGAALPATAQMLLEAPPEETETVVIQPREVQFEEANTYVLEDMLEVGEGYYTNASDGDVVLENDLARFIFGKVPEGVPRYNQVGELVLGPGALLDVTTAPSAPEGLHLFTPAYNGIREISHYAKSIDNFLDANGKAVVEVVHGDVLEDYVEMTTRYEMFRDVPGVLATTTVTNTSNDTTSRPIDPSDIVLWGSLGGFVPGRGYSSQIYGQSNVEFVFGRMEDLWVMVAPAEGTATVYSSPEVVTLSYGDPQALEPGESRNYRRWILVSQQDPAFLYSYVMQRRAGDASGTVVGRVIERIDGPNPGDLLDRGPVPNADIFITPLGRENWSKEVRDTFGNKPYLIARTTERGEFNAVLPEGDYNIFASPPERLAPRPTVAAEIREDRVLGRDFGVSKASRLIYRLVDDETGQRVPGKITIEPLRGTTEPDLGPSGFTQSGNVVFSSHGSGIVELAPGNYRVIASRGIEYHTTEQRLQISKLRDTEQEFRLKRAFDTPGWVSADIGVRTNATPTSRVTPETRVVTAAAEGVEWLVTGDAGQATDLSGVVGKLGLGNVLKTSPGYRRSGKATPFLGDFLLFPTSICATGESPDFSMIANASSTGGLVSAMRVLCPDAVILLNRATWPARGFLTNEGYSREDSLLPEDHVPIDIDAFQVWEGKRQGVIHDDYRTFHKMLRAGYEIAALGTTNSHGTRNDEVGYPRVYIRSTADNPAEIDPAELARNIKSGLVSVTNGPFINLAVNGRPMGSQITDTDGTVDIDLTVNGANFVKITAISVNLNGRFVRRILLNPASMDASDGVLFPTKENPDASSFELPVNEDSVLDIFVEGNIENPLNPVNPFQVPVRTSNFPDGQFPVAISAPVFIDADGDGIVNLERAGTLEREILEEDLRDPIF